jgi:hypothetical protein
MFECAGALRTWSIENEPTAGTVADARQLDDHRLDYLEYEGPIAGNRGSVTRWDAGEYALEHADERQWRAVLSGGRIPGRLTLLRQPANHSWRVSFAAAPTSG